MSRAAELSAVERGHLEVVALFEANALLELKVAQLETALSSRIVIEQAKGAVSVRHAVTPAAAFELIRGSARRQHREIHGYCQEILDNGGRLDV